MGASFAELQKRARYQELRERLAGELARPWTWDAVLALLERLGVRDPYGFFASGWWLPPEALEDRAEVDRLAERLERAMRDGGFPTPEQGYGWEHVPLLESICGIRPADVVRRLVWNYALTPGEEAFLAIFGRFVAEQFRPGAAGG